MTSHFKIFSLTQFLRLCILAFSAFVVVACGGGAGTVGIPSGTSLFTNAPAAVTLNSGTASYTIGGGTATYRSSSSNINVATTSIKGTTLSIVSVAAGTAQITISDAAGASVIIAVTVSGGVTPTELFTTAPSSLTLAANVSSSFTIVGGKPGYLVSSSNTAVATVAINGNSLIISGVAAGSAQIHLFDSAGATVTVSVTVGSVGATEFFTTAPSALTLGTNVSSSFTIAGGKPGYLVSSSNTAVATVAINGNSFLISGIAAGSAQVHIFDSVGTTVTVSVTVGSGGVGTALYTTAASAITVAVSETNSFAIGGGKAPYTASSSNTGVASVSVSDTTLNIKGYASGTAQVLVFDASGTSVPITVVVGSGGTTTNLFVTSASSINIAVAASNTYTIGGGTAPYKVSSSNNAIATASTSGTTLLISGVSAGNAQVHVFDAFGASVAITVNVGSGGTTTNLFTTSPSSVDIAVSASNTYAIGGGIAPYSASSSNTGVASTSIAGTVLTINGLATGTAQVLVFDASGASVAITVNVGSGGTSTKLFTTSASSVDIKVSASNTYTVGGGTAPYNVSSSNKSIATASLSGTSLLVSGIAAGTAQVLVTDAVGASVTIDVTITGTASLVIDVQPNGATGNVGDVLQFLVSGASPAYSITVNNTSIATVSPASVATSGGSFSATLLNAGSTTITIVDALGQSKAFILTVSQLSTSLRLSPSALIIGEDSVTPIVLNIFGGAGPYRAFTSDQTLSSVSTSGASLTVGLGTNSGRCINPIDTSGVRVPNGTFDVIITVLDSLGASATSTITIKDNGVGTGAIAPGAPPCL